MISVQEPGFPGWFFWGKGVNGQTQRNDQTVGKLEAEPEWANAHCTIGSVKLSSMIIKE